MTNELTIFKTGAVQSTKFAGAQLPTERLDDGVAAGFPRVSYKGSKWGIRWQGNYTPIQVRMPDGMLIQSPYLDVVILKAAGHPNKAWYAGAYEEGATVAPPDCWSSNGQVPDLGAPNKQSRTCLGCVHNVWGSKLNRDTGQATRGKACMDSKRLAVVPVGDIENKAYGGPMMLSVPPSSLKRLGPYQNMLRANGFHYAGVWTRITFEAEAAFPLFNFDAVAALDDVQADKVLEAIKHPVIDRILDADQAQIEAWDDSAEAVHRQIGSGPATAAEAMAAAQGAKASTVIQFPTTAQPVQSTTPAEPKTPEQIEAEIAARVAQAVAQAGQVRQAVAGLPPGTAAAAAMGLPTPAPLPPPTPVATAPVEPDEPKAEAPEPKAPALPAGMTLPPGMTPEMAAAFMAQFGATQAPKRGRKRTPPVSPAATDTSAPAPVTGLAGPALPTPAAAATAPVSGPAASIPAGPDAAVATIMGSIGKLL